MADSISSAEAILQSIVAGDRVLANPKPTWNEPKRPQQLHATVLKVNNRTKKNGGPCVQVVHDTGRNGAGRIECFPPSNLVALRRLRLRDIFSTSSEPAPPPPYEWFADPPPPPAPGLMRHKTKTYLVSVPSNSGEAWSRGLRLPSYALKTRGPPAGAATRGAADAGVRVPVLPTLFVPGFPKSATTWLYTCISDAFTPRKAGCGADASTWNATSCPNRRFLLTPLTAQRWVRNEFILESRKETFFFGGTRQKFYKPDLRGLIGPDSSKGALQGEPPLWAWEHKQQRLHRSQKAVEAAQAAARQSAVKVRTRSALFREIQQRALFERLGKTCSLSRDDLNAAAALPSSGNGNGGKTWRDSYRHEFAKYPCAGDEERERKRKRKLKAKGSGNGGSGVEESSSSSRECLHTACHHVVRGEPSTATMQCSWEEGVHTSLKRNDSYCVASMLPYMRRGEYDLLVGDFTPNYLCDAEALPRLKASAEDPDALRFIVVMREPASRARSEWAMFALQWAWDPINEFGTSFATRVQQMKACNTTLFRNIPLLKSLPTHELASYLQSCWNYGGALMYATNSMYSVCVLHALRHFKREQFLFLRYEDMMAMTSSALLRLIGRFTGLYAGDDLLEQNQGPRCQPASRKGGRASRTYDTLSPEEKVWYNESSKYKEADRETLSALFAPYNQLLAELVGHEAFAWAN